MKRSICLVLLAAVVWASPRQTSAETASVTPVWGTSVSVSDPLDVFFRVGAYTEGWKFRGAAGGARVGDSPDGSRMFSIDMGGNTGVNVAAGALRFNGLADFSETGDGGVRAAWRIVPDADGFVQEAMAEARIPIGRVSGGFRVDGRHVAISEGTPENPHLFRGLVSRVEALGPDGEPWIQIDLPESAGILIQDNRCWGSSSVATLRLFFVIGNVEEGREYRLTAEFRAPGGDLSLSQNEQVVLAAGPEWIPFRPAALGEDWIEPGSAFDFSRSMPHHEPAGAFGRVVAVGDHFELADRPGEEIRFCGVNLVHGANTPSVESADRFAENLARMGFNSVRIHHHERPLLAKGDPAALTVDPDAQERFDALVAACIRHGIYITTDLYVSRAPISWRAVGVDRDGSMTKDEFKMLALFHEGAHSNLVAWTRQFLLHVNPHTGRSLADEPALATLALVNEGNLGNYGRDALLAIPGVEDAWREWCAAHGREPAPLSELPADLYQGKGKSKDLSDEFALFLADRETLEYRRLSKLLREELGCKAPLSSLSSWYNPASYCLSRAEFDYDDDHGYVDHPYFLGKSWRLPSSHPASNPLLGSDGAPGFAWRRLFGKPFCVTEWNWAAPGEYRMAYGLVMGALAARQGWSGLWRFAWSHDRDGVEAPGSVRMRYFDLHADPALCASERATLSLFLRGDLAPLSAESDAAIVFDESSLRAGKDAALRLAPPPAAPSCWKNRVGVRLARQDAAVPSDTGKESTAPATARQETAKSNRAWSDPIRGSFAVDTPRTAGGFALDGTISTSALTFTLDGVPAAVWASSVDGLPLRDSACILVSHVTDSKNTGARFDDAACRVWLEYGTTPALVRRGEAKIEMSLAPGGEAAVWRLSSTGRRVALVPSEFDSATGLLSFAARTDFDPDSATLAYEVAR